MIKMIFAYLKARGRESSTYAGLGVLALWLQMQTGYDFSPLLEAVPEALSMIATGNWLGGLVPLLLGLAAFLKQDRPGDDADPSQWVVQHPQQPRAPPPMPPQPPVPPAQSQSY